MRILITITILFVGAWFGVASNVTFNLTDFISTVQPLQKKTVMIEPQSTPTASSNTIIISERRSWNLGTNGSFVATNMITGYYMCNVYGLTYTSRFRIYVPETQSNYLASDIYIPRSSDTGLLIDGGAGDQLFGD